MKRFHVVGLLLLTVTAVLAACQHAAGGKSNVSVFMTDAPLDLTGVSAVNVTISSVVLYPADETGDDGGVALASGPISTPGDLTINLLDFRNGAMTFIGSANVPAGSYSRIRLEIVSAELVHDDDGDPNTPDVVSPIVVPSSKVDVVAPFQLSQGDDLALTLDFDAQASVQVNLTGNDKYLLRPVINLAHASGF